MSGGNRLEKGNRRQRFRWRRRPRGLERGERYYCFFDLSTLAVPAVVAAVGVVAGVSNGKTNER